MRLSTKLSGIVAVGGVAALGAGLISSGGIGAAFTSGATATATIGTGTFGCEIVPSTPPAPGVTISADGKTASVDLGIISSSATSSRSAVIRIHNSGSIPAIATWQVSKTGNLTSSFTPIPAVTIPLGATDAENMAIGFTWTALQNTDLNRSGQAVYNLTCVEAGQFGQDWLIAKTPTNISVFGDSNYLATWSNGATPGIHVAEAGDGGISGGMQASVAKLLDVAEGSALPLTEPTFTTTDGTQEVRMSIKLSNGSYIVRYPASWTSATNWSGFASLISGYSGDGSWASLASAANSAGLTVTKVFLIADSPAGVDQTITCINYSGTPLFGTCS